MAIVRGDLPYPDVPCVAPTKNQAVVVQRDEEQASPSFKINLLRKLAIREVIPENPRNLSAGLSTQWCGAGISRSTQKQKLEALE